MSPERKAELRAALATYYSGLSQAAAIECLDALDAAEARTAKLEAALKDILASRDSGDPDTAHIIARCVLEQP